MGKDDTIALVALLTAGSAFVLALILSVLQERRRARQFDLTRLFAKADRIITARRVPEDDKVIDLIATMYVVLKEAEDTGTLDPDTLAAYQERAKVLFDILESSPEFGVGEKTMAERDRSSGSTER